MKEPVWVWVNIREYTDAVPVQVPFANWQAAANQDIMFTKRS